MTRSGSLEGVSIADVYFFGELRNHCGQRVASEWITNVNRKATRIDCTKSLAVAKRVVMEEERAASRASSAPNFVLGRLESVFGRSDSGHAARRQHEGKESQALFKKLKACPVYDCKQILPVPNISVVAEQARSLSPERPVEDTSFNADQMSLNSTDIDAMLMEYSSDSDGFSRTKSVVDLQNAHLLFTDAAHLAISCAD